MNKQVVRSAPSAPPRAKVLVVDDDAVNRLVCSTWLGLDGYDVIEAENGQIALELAFTEAPDLVLLDLSMPILDGFGVAAALRADERTRSLPVVVLSGESRPAVAERVDELGVIGFFSKPFDPGAITAFVRAAIEEVGNRRAATSGNA